MPEPSDATLRLERNRPEHERAHRGDLRVRIEFTLTYVRRARTHVHRPIDVAMNLRENLTLFASPVEGVSRTDRPTDVIQRQRLTPPCKTIRLRSHCWESHYLTLSIRGNDLQHEDKHTSSFLLVLPPWISTRESREQRNGEMA